MCSGEITFLLKQLATEVGPARKRIYDELVSLVYEDLRSRARQELWREYGRESLQPTALVHEAYQRLLQYEMAFENRDHFFNVAAKAMRRLLIDRARSQKSAKRGRGQQAVEPGEAWTATNLGPEMLIALDEVLSTLRPEQIQLVELRFFAGLSMQETARAMDLKPETVKKRWQVIKLLLYDKLKQRMTDESR